MMNRGSWIVGRGSWIVGRGSWIVGRGSWIVGRGWDAGRGLSIATLAALMAVSCGGGSDSPTSPSTGTSGTGTVITITSSGVSPSTLTVSPGTRVTFVNNDSRVHEMSSDPHPEHTTCIELNQVGFLTAGQSRETGNLNTVRTCGYHDHLDDGNARWKGQIIVR